jgi:hypothetical protein
MVVPVARRYPMEPWSWLGLGLAAGVGGVAIAVGAYGAVRAVNKWIRVSQGKPDGSADHLIIVSQLWLGGLLVVLGATLGLIFGVLLGANDTNKIALSIGTAVIGVGAALLPAGAAASASARLRVNAQDRAG